MKIAVTTQEDQIFQHFGKCPNFTLFSVENGMIQSREMLDASGNGHAALAGFLKSTGVDAVICGGIGDGAKTMLASEGIRLISGVKGGVEDAVHAFLAGDLTDQGGTCDKEEHTQDHACSCENHCKQ